MPNPVHNSMIESTCETFRHVKATEIGKIKKKNWDLLVGLKSLKE